MTIYNAGDVLYAPMEYVGGAGQKNRPVLVVLDTGDLDIVVSRITSRPVRDSYDVMITDLASAGLPSTSIVRISKIATIPRSGIVKQLGCLSALDRQAVQSALQSLTDSFN